MSAKRYDNEKFTTPIGRFLWGSLYEPQTKNYSGAPLRSRSGNDYVKYTAIIGIPKGPEQHWQQTEWGAYVYNHVAQQFGGNVPPHFVWKIEDGDTTVVNKKGTRNCDKEGYPGHWIIRTSTGYPPSAYDAFNKVYLQEKDAILPGDYVEVRIIMEVGKGENPSLFLNQSIVSLNRRGERITTFAKEDPDSVGFSPGVAGAPASIQGYQPAAQTPQQQYAPVQAQQQYVPPVPQPYQPTVPHNQILGTPQGTTQMPAVPNGNGPGAPPPDNGSKRMAAHAPFTYEQYLGAGWTDKKLVEAGLLLQ